MAKQETTESTGPGGDTLRAASSQYRSAAGLPERKDNKPTDLTDPGQLTKRYEPEGGYGGKDGITNNSALNATEEARAKSRAEAAEERAEKIEETGLSGGETATQEAIVTGEDVTDVKPAPETTPEEKAPAKKAAAKGKGK